MPRPAKTEDSVVLKFGGGIHSRASPDEIDLRECAEGQNFTLDLQNREMRPRKGFDLVGTAPNAAQINGFISLRKADGTVKLAVQAGTAVYDIDSAYDFGSSIATVNTNARMRGRIEANWELGDKVLITDMALAQDVYEWDGTTMQAVTFTKNDGSTAWTNAFRAKYCIVDDERAIFANIYDNASSFPHLIVGSDRSDYTIISNDNRPSSSLGEGDAFFLIQPDLRPINGIVKSWNKIVTSSRGGSLYRLNGSSSKDFAFVSTFPRSGAEGDEALVYAGNDVIYGRQGRIESATATEQFGDVDTNDLSEDINDQIETYDGWTMVYNQRLQRVYCFPDNQNEIWVFHKPVLGTGLSPWSKFVTSHTTTFQPTAVMNALDPNDGLEYTYFGDSSGNVYKLEGTGADQTTDIVVSRTSGLFKVPADLQAFNVQGWILYRGLSTDVTVTLEFQYAGENVFNETITEVLSGTDAGWYWGGSNYWSSDDYWGTSFNGRLIRKKFGVPGQSNELQLKVTVQGSASFQINEIGLNFSAAN